MVAVRDRLALRRLPISVKLNRSLFPIDFISLVAKPGKTLGGLAMQRTTLSDVLKATSGDGFRPRPLSPGDSIDIFVRDESSYSNAVYSVFDRLEVVNIRRGSPTMFRIKWDTVNNEDLPGEFSLVWSHEDRAAGRAPFIAIGSASEKLAQYADDQAHRIPPSRFDVDLRIRIPEMSQRDTQNRVAAEQMDSLTSKENLIPSHARTISVEGFRGFRESATLRMACPDGAEGSGLTFVVGANNAGKSTVWESFDAVSRKLKNDVSFSAGRRNRATLNGIRIRMDFNTGVSYQVLSRNNDTSETKDEWSPSQPNLLPEIVTVPSRRQFQATFSRGGTAQRDWMAQQNDFTRSRQNDQFTGRLFDLHNDDAKKEKFDQLMAEVLGHELKWTIDLGEGQYGQSYYLKVTTGDGVDHSSEGLGDGIISLLFILNALYDSEPETLLVFDEPELSLHPQLVKRLGRVLARFAKDRQIVVFTHSPHLLSWDDIANGAEIARVYKSGPDSKIAQPTRVTVMEVANLRRSWRNPHILGVDANEVLFLDDGVILVEGQEDAALFPRAFEQVGIEMPGTIFGWGSGGEGNPEKLAALLNELGFERVAVILDNNVHHTADRIRANHPGYLVQEIPAADVRDKPASAKEAVVGLLDEKGKRLKPEMKAQAEAAFSAVRSYLKSTPQVVSDLQASTTKLDS
ncbi:hypothetical protein GCM10009860_15500 [Microbacterium mitrae]|uniref:AAA family ATPase n=1 Tax=Microbacterium mitrae TaxID=664640 RepID=A0A5C8HKC3_9MICO|nr:ATP-binding protein [Microbacterium mitrae]TXK03374.1 AAA family ATPase [Microbacterium mitrae]